MLDSPTAESPTIALPESEVARERLEVGRAPARVVTDRPAADPEPGDTDPGVRRHRRGLVDEYPTITEFDTVLTIAKVTVLCVGIALLLAFLIP